MPRTCQVEGCESKHNALGYCCLHYQRMRRKGDPVAANTMNPMRSQIDCRIDDCPKPAQARHLCAMHYARWRKWGDPLFTPKATKTAERAALDWRSLADIARVPFATYGDGYRKARWCEHPGASKSGDIHEHSAVMSAVLGRRLRPGEFVHHINGVRHDNRPENLELWVRAHPPGQRVSELIQFAHDLLEQYKDDMQLWPEHLRP